MRAGQWYGRWWANGRRVKRKLGPIRAPGTREGLTRAQVERELRRRIEADAPAPAALARLTVQDAGERLLRHLESLGRKRSTVEGYESYLRVHLAPFFRDRPLEQLDRDDVEAFMAHCRRNGQSVKSTLNYVGLLHGIFEYAIGRGWLTGNPCKRIDKPRAGDADPDIRFLDATELDALAAAAAPDALGRVEAVSTSPPR